MLVGCCGFALALANEMGEHPGGITVYAFAHLVGWLISLAMLAYWCRRFDRGPLAVLLSALLIPLGIVLLCNRDLLRMLLSLYYVTWYMWTAHRLLEL